MKLTTLVLSFLICLSINAQRTVTIKVGTDTSSISRRINNKLNIADTTLLSNQIVQLRSVKQNSLVSGTNIKTINSTSIMGTGNINVQTPITTGTISQYFRGDLSLVPFPTIPPQANIVGVRNISVGGTYPNLTITSTLDTLPLHLNLNTALNGAVFDTSARSLILTKIDGSSTSVIIPRGGSGGAGGISALSNISLRDSVKISGDNGSTTTFNKNPDSTVLYATQTGLASKQVKGNYTITVSTIDSLINHISPLVNTVIVSDSLQGGTFNRVSSGTVDSGIVFNDNITGQFWKRNYSGYINVKFYGIIGDGITDNTSKIHNMINSMGKTGTMYFPKGVYCGFIHEYFLKDFNIAGDGNSSVLKLPNGVNKTLIFLGVSNNIHISNITLDGNRVNNTTNETPDYGEGNQNDCIYISKGSGFIISQDSIVNGRGNGISGYLVTGVNVQFNTIKNCSNSSTNVNLVTIGYTQNNKGSSISFNHFSNNPFGTAYTSFQSNNVTVMGNIIDSCKTGISIEWGGSNNIVGSNKINNVGEAIAITNITGNIAKHNIVSDNVATNCSGTIDGGISYYGFIACLGLNGGSIHNNILIGSSGNLGKGISLSKSSNVIISGNTIKKAGSHGIYLDNNIYYGIEIPSNTCDTILVSKNTIISAGGNGINLNGGKNNAITDNIINGSTLNGLFLDSCVNSIVKNNLSSYNNQYGIVFNNCSNNIESGNTFNSNTFSPDLLITGININNISSNRTNIQRTLGIQAPTSGNWGFGDKVYNSIPIKGQPEYWLNIQAGSPGIWTSGPILDTPIGFTSNKSQWTTNVSGIDYNKKILIGNNDSTSGATLRDSSYHTILNRHSIDDYSHININVTPIGSGGYASFDTYASIYKSVDINHIAGYQARMQISGIGRVLSHVDGFGIGINNDSGNINIFRGINLQRTSGSGTFNYKFGIYIDSMYGYTGQTYGGILTTNAIYTNTGVNRFGDVILEESNAPSISLTELDGGTDSKRWDELLNGGIKSYRFVSDDNSSATPYMQIWRYGMNLSQIVYPQNSPTIYNGSLQVNNGVTFNNLPIGLTSDTSLVINGGILKKIVGTSSLGTTNIVSKFIGPSNLGNSQITDNGITVGLTSDTLVVNRSGAGFNSPTISFASSNTKLAQLSWQYPYGIVINDNNGFTNGVLIKNPLTVNSTGIFTSNLTSGDFTTTSVTTNALHFTSLPTGTPGDSVLSVHNGLVGQIATLSSDGTYTPTMSGSTVSTYNIRNVSYTIVGKTCDVEIGFDITPVSGSTNLNITVTTPFAASSTYTTGQQFIGEGSIIDGTSAIDPISVYASFSSVSGSVTASFVRSGGVLVLPGSIHFKYLIN